MWLRVEYFLINVVAKKIVFSVTVAKAIILASNTAMANYSVILLFWLQNTILLEHVAKRNYFVQ
jgi:hypothetical protein